MIIWLNGAFGAGKTTTTRRLLAARPDWAPFDTEIVGVMLQHALGRRSPVRDFQDWPAWRTVSIASLVAVRRELGVPVVVPQTVVVEAYWTELAAGLAEAGEELRAFTLHVDGPAHETRIATDALEPGAAGWRRDRRADYDAALGWLAGATTLVDTTDLTPDDVATRILTDLAHP